MPKVTILCIQAQFRNAKKVIGLSSADTTYRIITCGDTYRDITTGPYYRMQTIAIRSIYRIWRTIVGTRSPKQLVRGSHLVIGRLRILRILIRTGGNTAQIWDFAHDDLDGGEKLLSPLD